MFIFADKSFLRTGLFNIFDGAIIWCKIIMIHFSHELTIINEYKVIYKTFFIYGMQDRTKQTNMQLHLSLQQKGNVL